MTITTLNTLTNSSLIEMINNGSVGVLPTDTVYGIVCSAKSSTAVSRLYGLKKREQKPGTIIAESVQQLVDLGIKARYLKAVEHFWPNSLSIVIPCGEDLTYLHRGLRSLAVRVPMKSDLTTLLGQVGPLLTTSANRPADKPAVTIAEAQAVFGDTVDFYVDGGDLSARETSTVIRIVDDAIEILRPGAIKINENGAIET